MTKGLSKNRSSFVASDIRFYASYPIRVASGEKIGTLCLIDTKPRHINIQALSLLKKVVTIIELELVKKNNSVLCFETHLLNKVGFHQLADHAVKACREVNLPLSFVYFYINGLLGLKSEDKEKYFLAINIIKAVFNSGVNNSDFISNYEDAGFVALFSNADIDNAREKAKYLCQTLTCRLAEISSTNLHVVHGAVQDDGVSKLENLIFNSFAQHYQNAKN